MDSVAIGSAAAPHGPTTRPPPRPICAGFATPCSIGSGRAARGVCCRGTLAGGRPFTITSGFGASRAIGTSFTTCCAAKCGRRLANGANPPPRLWIARRCVRRTKRGSVASTRPRKPKGSSGIFWWTRWGCCWRSASHQPTCPNGPTPAACWMARWPRFAGCAVLWADQGYGGEALAAWVAAHRKTGTLHLDVVPRDKSQRGFATLPKRWIVERTFGGVMKHRRLVRPYEVQPSHAEAWLRISMIGLMLRRLA